MNRHPFLSDRNSLYTLMPSQNVSLEKKQTEQWKRDNMDCLEHIARIQYWDKLRYINNYKILNGEFVPEYYTNLDKSGEEDFDLLNYVQEKFDLPKFIKNYDVVSQPVNTLLGELDAYPDIFSLRGRGDIFENEKNMLKTHLLKQWVEARIDMKVKEMMYQDGLDPESEDYSPEQAEQLQVAYDHYKSILWPKEIETYINTEYRHLVEIWGQYELEDQSERFNLRGKRRTEFTHVLAVGQRFRHIYYDGKNLRAESINPRYFFGHKSPNTLYVQDGDIAGFVEILTVSDVIDKYGHLMTENQLNSLEDNYKVISSSYNARAVGGRRVTYSDPYGRPYNTPLLSEDMIINNFFPKMKELSSTLGDFFDSTELEKTGGSSFIQAANGLLIVIRGYWKTQKRVGKLTWNNPETGEFEVLMIDENFEIPDYITEIKDKIIDDVSDINTVVWTRDTEIYEGIKINNYATTGFLKEPLYIGIGPAELQIGKLPIGGQYFNNLNTQPTGLVDKILPIQFFVNVLLNQAYQQIQTELGPFVVAETNTLPNDKDWGDDPLGKWLTTARISQAAPISTSPVETGGANSGGQFPRVIDLDRGSRILTRFNLAMAFRQLAWEQIGVNQQRQGNIKASETATGVNQAVNASYTQTSGWFTEFFDCEREILQMQIDAAKYIQANGDDLTSSYVKSDLTQQLVKLDRDLNLYDLHIYVSNSQEELRSINIIRQYALQNNTELASTVSKLSMLTSSSKREIMELVEQAEREMTEENKRRFNEELEVRKQELALDREKYETELKYKYDELENKIKERAIMALGFSKGLDANENMTDDIVDYANLYLKGQQIESANSFNMAKIENERIKENNRANETQQKLLGEREKRRHEMKMEQEMLKRARVQGDKTR